MSEMEQTAKSSKKRKVENGSSSLEGDEIFDESELIVNRLENIKESIDNELEATPVMIGKSEILARRLENVPCGNVFSEQCFQYLISPVEPEEFFQDIWEKRPIHVRRYGKSNYYKIFTCKEFDRIMRQNLLAYSKNIDIVRYSDGVRETMDLEGRAYASVVWKYYQDGCSIRMLNPQAYCEKLWVLCAHLQEYFGSYVGVNMYLTPPGSQGFAPHYDDIEAFVLQLEGRKLWRIYAPRKTAEQLPRFSSSNFTQDEIGIPILEVEVEAGDLLYFPRGYIHQARTTDEAHSLHVTVSTYQKNTWGDLLKIMLPLAVEQAVKDDIEFRKSLPKDYMNYVGIANENMECEERINFFHKCTDLAQKLVKYLPIDEATDQHAKDFIHASLPPKLTPVEQDCSIHHDGVYWEKNILPFGAAAMLPDTKIRLLRKRSIRLVMEDNGFRLYHNLENGRDYKEFESKYVDLDRAAANGIIYLLESHPEFVHISDLPFDDIEDKMVFANDLYENGLLITEEPLEGKD